jgi:outer membrane protein assembly factor BamB
LKRVLTLVILCLFLLPSLVVNSYSIEEPQIQVINDKGPMDSPWPMKSRDQYHTSQSPYNTSHNSGAQLWKYRSKSDDYFSGGIAIDKEGILYFGDWPHGYLYSIYPNGTTKWIVSTGGGITSTPALAEDGTIYIGSWDDYLYAFNPNGTLKWRYCAFDSIYASPTIGSDGTIYFDSLGWPVDGYALYALNPNGTEKWKFKQGQHSYSTPAIGLDDTIYITCYNGFIYALNPNGTLKWGYKSSNEAHSHPSVGLDGTVYFGSNDYYFYALYPNGTLKWKYKIDGHLYSSAAIGSDGIIYCPDHDLYAFYPNGTLKWRFDFGEDKGVAQSSPAISQDGIIYIGVCERGYNGGYIYAINPNGTERWSRRIANRAVLSSPSISPDGTVYIGSEQYIYPNEKCGYLYAFGKGDLPPSTPSIEGPSTSVILVPNEFRISSRDPDFDQIYYYIDWGDESNSDWVGPIDSEEVLFISHTWYKQGDYKIRAQAKDSTGKLSDWSTLEITMPKTKVSLWERLVYWFPILEEFLFHNSNRFERINCYWLR